MGMMKAITGDDLDREAYVNRQALLYGVQRAMFCPRGDCGRILDIRSAALVTVKKDGATTHADVVCASHLDETSDDGRTRREVIAAKVAAIGSTIEIIDGRDFTVRGEYRADVRKARKAQTQG